MQRSFSIRTTNLLSLLTLGGLMFISLPNFVNAYHTPEHIIQELQAQVRLLQQQQQELQELVVKKKATIAMLPGINHPTSSEIFSGINEDIDESLLRRNLTKGSNGSDVAILQKTLEERGVYAGPITGYFGPITQTAVKKYQQQSGLPSTGIAGLLTRNLLQNTRAFFKFGYKGAPETFIIKLTDSQKIAYARDILAGKITDAIHVSGVIIKKSKKYNIPWSYYLKSSSINFFEIAPEVCDAGIQYTETHLAEVGGEFLPNSQWCPWGSYLIEEIKQSSQPTVSISPNLVSAANLFVEGQTEIIHFDDFQRGVASDNYFLNTADGKRFILRFTGEGLPDIRSSERIRVRAKKQNNELIINQEEAGSIESLNLKSSPDIHIGMMPITKKVAVILLNLQDNPTQPFTPDEARTIVFTGASSVNGYYQETSFGNFTLQGALRANGDIFGWYTVPYNSAICQDGYWTIAARNAAAAEGFVENNYTNIIFAWPYASSCPWEGSSNLGGSYSYNNGSFGLKVIAHELGHNFNLHHASSYDCVNVNGKRMSISNTCTANEYGDPFDMMDGNPYRSTNHFNVFNKGRLNWFSGQNIQDVAQSGTYTIASLETASSKVQALRIPRKVKLNGKIVDYYYLEFRQPFGFDNFNPSDPVVNGVSIRIAPGYNKISKTLLIDATADTSTFIDAALKIGEIFQDKQKGIIIKTIAVTSTEATVNIIK